MTKNEIAAHVAEQAGVTKSKAGAMLAALTDLIHVELRSGRDIAIPEVGVFKVKAQAERSGISPATKQPYHSPARKVAKFKPAKALADAVA